MKSCCWGSLQDPWARDAGKRTGLCCWTSTPVLGSSVFQGRHPHLQGNPGHSLIVFGHRQRHEGPCPSWGGMLPGGGDVLGGRSWGACSWRDTGKGVLQGVALLEGSGAHSGKSFLPRLQARGPTELFGSRCLMSGLQSGQVMQGALQTGPGSSFCPTYMMG